MADKVKVVQYGVGPIGAGIVRLLSKKEGFEYVGAIERPTSEKLGKDLGLFVGLDQKLGVEIRSDAKAVLSETKPDLVIHTTTSYVRQIKDQLFTIIDAGADIVSTSEELSYPYLSEPELSRKLDEAAKKKGVTILGTGINPGFLMDTLPIVLTGVCQEVRSIEVTRQMNASTRRLPFQRKIGAGLTVEEFKEKIETKAITGHVGLEQSLAMIAAALNWKLDDIEVGPVEPVVVEEPVESKFIKVDKRKVAGLRQRAYGVMKGEKVITLNFYAYLGAKEEYDSIIIDGVPPVNERISPCVHGDLSTVAVTVNSIPLVLKAPPGLLTMMDLPIPRALLCDVRELLEKG